jgi:predicted metal-dependent hydrolase
MQLGLPFAPSTPHQAPRTQLPAPSTSRDDITFVRHPRARRYVIRVATNGGIRVTVPRGGSKRQARAFAEQQRTWVEKQRRKLALDRQRPRQTIDPEIENNLRARAKLELPARLLELAAQNELRVVRVSVRNQRWRWGSCAPNGHICLNWRLVQMPPEIRDYVMIHELMHLKRMDHSSRFWRLVALACPDYQDARRWLREHARQGTPLAID